MRDFSPLPMLSRYAVRSSTARTARKSRSAAPGTVAARQCAPPSEVRRYVPLVPPAQTTVGLTALTPRSEAVVLLSCGTHDCAPATLASRIHNASLIMFHTVY